MRVRVIHGTAALACAVAGGAMFAGCQGGGATAPVFSTGTAAPTPTPTLTPTPTPTPTATPTPSVLGVTPNTVAMTVVGATAPFTASETAYTGTLTAANGTPSCSGIATVAPATASGPSGNFTVTAVAAGQCQLTVKDTNGQTATVTVYVTTTGGTISSKHRRI
ncbi:MAG: hypothetical protein JOZ86_06305 [Candidatus Eremiobacteraeota bacterium]|nr:hypothetical protein [Candidatus Eremiobacteraeota bacterium]